MIGSSGVKEPAGGLGKLGVALHVLRTGCTDAAHLLVTIVDANGPQTVLLVHLLFRASIVGEAIELRIERILCLGLR